MIWTRAGIDAELERRYPSVMSIVAFRSRAPFAAAFLSLMAAFGCGSEPPPSAAVPTSAPAATLPPPSSANATNPAAAAATPDACSEIAGFCHMHDSKGAPGAAASLIHECHELGHAHKLEACVARKQECLDACAQHAH